MVGKQEAGGERSGRVGAARVSYICKHFCNKSNLSRSLSKFNLHLLMTSILHFEMYNFLLNIRFLSIF